MKYSEKYTLMYYLPKGDTEISVCKKTFYKHIRDI